MITAKYIRGLIVFLTLVLAAAANLMYFSCDADHNEATPPVIVEFQFLVRGHSGATSQSAFLAVGLTPGQPQVQALSFKGLIGSMGEPLTIEQSSAPVQLPLLC